MSLTSLITTAYRARIEAEHLTPDPAQEAVLSELDCIAMGLRNAPQKGGSLGWMFAIKSEPVRGLYLWGGVGRGKSMLMDLFHEAAGVEKSRRVHFHAFMQEVQTALHAARKTGVDDAIRPVADEMAAGLQLLCLDEMQITDIADAMIVGRLFERMFEAGVTVVTTSNRPPDDLYKDGLNRALFLPFISLMKDKMEVWHLHSPRDWRQDRLEGAKTYFHPADAAARAEVSALWQDFAGDASHPLVLKVKGREVTIPAFANGVARAQFYDLCGQPLGPADYLALADAIRVLILEDIPRLSSENYNQARRFVTLIDALYEARIRLIATAADTPENLYIEGEGSFEFERTASRLREMQSAEWMAED
ncbi:cell division protein ZapE [Boseongicola aestuarii]|uniref:AFG1-like ATPase n=1 Tax=Boseongicola aestuarii TaxID=1470561 RepID=A0A238IV95_9RHOB|nr:AFG1-like ATPase [Boseongicola aestuarii]